MLDNTALSLTTAGGTGSEAAGKTGKLRVFISYSRSDLDFADQLYAALTACGFDPSLDRHDIPGGEEWRARLTAMIGEADTIVFVLSPVSARSEVCTWEVDEALRFGKRIIPVICAPLGAAQPPSRLREINYVFFYAEPKAPGSGFGLGLMQLVDALNTDYDWLRAHTHYLQQAMNWISGGRQASRLLSGTDIAEAKAWMGRRPLTAPEVGEPHREFIRASEDEAVARGNAQRRQLEEMAAAQAERETALRKAEAALQQAADARRRRAQIRNGALVAVSALALVATGFWWKSENYRRVGDNILEASANVILKLKGQFNEDAQGEVINVFETGAEQGNARAMNLYGAMLQLGLGMPPNDQAARMWFERSAGSGDPKGMHNLGVLYEKGKGVPRDCKVAAAWYERAASHGDAIAMTSLGKLYFDGGPGFPRDTSMARSWMGKAVRAGDPQASVHIMKIDVREAADAKRYGDALSLQMKYTQLVRQAEIKVHGQPGDSTAAALAGSAWYALLNRSYEAALTYSQEAKALAPSNPGMRVNEADALMLLGRANEAKTIYLENNGAGLPDEENLSWNDVVAGDFELMRSAGLMHPLMDEIARELALPGKVETLPPSSGPGTTQNDIRFESTADPSGAP